MNEKRGLTRFQRIEVEGRRELMTQLDRAGLELWQAPEGFLAIRAKPAPEVAEAPSCAPARPARRAG